MAVARPEPGELRGSGLGEEEEDEEEKGEEEEEEKGKGNITQTYGLLDQTS